MRGAGERRIRLEVDGVQWPSEKEVGFMLEHIGRPMAKIDHVFARLDYWLWLFHGDARKEFMRMQGHEQRTAIKAALRFHASAQNATTVYLRYADDNAHNYTMHGTFDLLGRQMLQRSEFVMTVWPSGTNRLQPFTILKSRESDFRPDVDWEDIKYETAPLS